MYLLEITIPFLKIKCLFSVPLHMLNHDELFNTHSHIEHIIKVSQGPLAQ